MVARREVNRVKIRQFILSGKASSLASGMSMVAKTEKVVASLFPSNIRDRLLAEEEDFERKGVERGARTRLKDFLTNDGPDDGEMEETDDFMFKTQPIADLFPETSIM